MIGSGSSSTWLPRLPSASSASSLCENGKAEQLTRAIKSIKRGSERDVGAHVVVGDAQKHEDARGTVARMSLPRGC